MSVSRPYAGGYTDEKSQTEILQSRGLPFVHKPYNMAGLLGAVRAVLDGRKLS